MTSSFLPRVSFGLLVLGALSPLGCGGGGSATRDAGGDTDTECIATASQEQSCSGGVDEDCDTYVDCLDVDCAGSPSCQSTCVPVPENSQSRCANGDDDDCDGLTDCADPNCIQPGVFSCLGRSWSSRCVSPLTGSQTMTTTGVELLLTSSGVSGTAGHSTSGVTLDIVTVGASASATAVNLLVPPNDDRDSCTHCFVLHRGGKDFFVRRANVVVSELPTVVGEPFSATLTGTFEEVTMNGNQVVPTEGGECLLLDWTITGTAVNTTATLGIAGAGAAFTAGAQTRSGHTSELDVCNEDETLANNPYDCACSNAPQIACPGGHSCPAGSVCLSQGRCECFENYVGLDCATGAGCGTNGSACSAGSGWSCLHLGCGIQNYTVSCGNGYACPTHSTCSGSSCVCEPGYEWVPCPTEGGSPYGNCVRTLIPACSTEYDPSSTSCTPPGEEGGIWCGANSTCGPGRCDCEPGYVSATCDGIRCSDENDCDRRNHGCFPDAQVP